MNTHIDISRIINAPVENVYKSAEKYPEFVSFYDKKVTELNTSTYIKIHLGMKFLGIIPIRWTGEGTKERNKFICYVQTKGLLKGLQSKWIFTIIDENKTKVTISIIFSTNFLFASFFRNYLAIISMQHLHDLQSFIDL
jgi:ribosome-associated toxin RatA of RatAB toxin-antitoxin module